MGSLAKLARYMNMKSMARWTSGFFITLAVAGAAEPTSAPATSDSQTIHATVSKNSVNLRTAPDIHSRAIRIRLNKGDVLIVRRASQPEWFEIQLPTPFKGYFVRQDLVTLDESK